VAKIQHILTGDMHRHFLAPIETVTPQQALENVPARGVKVDSGKKLQIKK
jgi:hypothetical protein